MTSLNIIVLVFWRYATKCFFLLFHIYLGSSWPHETWVLFWFIFLIYIPNKKADSGKNKTKYLTFLERKKLLKWNRKHCSYFEKGISSDPMKQTSLEVPDITFIKSLKRKIQVHQKTVKTLDLAKALTIIKIVVLIKLWNKKYK